MSFWGDDDDDDEETKTDNEDSDSSSDAMDNDSDDDSDEESAAAADDNSEADAVADNSDLSRPDDDSAVGDQLASDDGKPPLSEDQRNQLLDSIRNKFASNDNPTPKPIESPQSDLSRAADRTQLDQALANSRSANNVANFGSALETLGRANSMAHGGAGTDQGFYDRISAQGQKGVQEAQNNRQMAVNDFMQQNAVKRQIAQDMMTKGNYDQKQAAAKWIQDDHTPGTPAAVAAANAIGKMNIGISPDDLKGMSAFDIRNNIDNLAKVKAGLDTKQEIANARAQQASDAAAGRKQMADMAAGNRQDAVDAKTGKAQQDNAVKTEAAMQGSGRAPANVKMAFANQIPVQNALELMAQHPDGKYTAQQASLLGAEMEKVATGGAGTEGGRNSQVASSLQKNWNDFMQKVDNKPTPTDMSAFMGQNKQYLMGIKQNQDDVISKYQYGVYQAAKPGLSKEYQADVEDRYADNLSNAQAQLAAAKQKRQTPLSAPAQQQPAPGFGEAVGAPGPQVDDKISGYAKQNNLDYQTARRVLLNKGYQPNE